MFGGNNVSLADIAAVTGNNRNNGMFGDGGWWAWILMFALFGWGNGGMFGGWGANGGFGGNQFVEAQIQRGFDNQTVLTKLEGIQNGLSSLGYDQLAQMNGLGNTVQQTGWNLQQTMNQNAIAQMQRDFAAQQQASDCCCENRVGQMNIINQMDKNNCATNGAIREVGQQIMWANQQGFRDISDQISAGFAQMEKDAVMRENADLRQRLNDCNLENALRANAEYVTNRCCPRSEPAYLTCNPNTGNVFPQAGLDQLAYQQWLMERQGCCQPRNNCCCNNGF